MELSGDEQTFTATITFDTKDLFGKFEATREIKLKNPEEKKDEEKKTEEKAEK